MSRDDVPAQRIQFGEKVRKARLAAGLSQEKASEFASIHPTYWSSVERGQRNVGIDNIYKIARALNVSPADLI